MLVLQEATVHFLVGELKSHMPCGDAKAETPVLWPPHAKS